MKSRSKNNTKAISSLIFFLIVAAIGVSAYIGARGMTVGSYRFKSFSEVIKKGLDLQGGVSILEEIQDEKVDQKTIDRTIELISMRTNKLGVSETVVTKEGTKRIRIEIPGIYDTKSVIDTVGKTGELKFVGPDGVTIITGKDVKDASSYINPETNKPEISLELNDSGTKKFADATEKFMGQPIGIYMDDQELTKPNVSAHITNGKARIEGSKSLEEATRQANIIKSGALPATVKPVEVRTVGATLGANALPLSVKAGAISIAIILLFMLIYYRLPGLIADIALILYMVIVLGSFVAMDAVLTLSGIAGFLLSVGMALDANILIFERMKEELKSGKSPRAAIDAGFHRAMSSVIDSNLTTIISGIILYNLGSGSVKGFALTLIIGNILSLFTAVTVTRTLVKLAANMGLFKKEWTIGTFWVYDIAKEVK